MSARSPAQARWMAETSASSGPPAASVQGPEKAAQKLIRVYPDLGLDPNFEEISGLPGQASHADFAGESPETGRSRGDPRDLPTIARGPRARCPTWRGVWRGNHHRQSSARRPLGPAGHAVTHSHPRHTTGTRRCFWRDRCIPLAPTGPFDRIEPDRRRRRLLPAWRTVPSRPQDPRPEDRP